LDVGHDRHVDGHLNDDATIPFVLFSHFSPRFGATARIIFFFPARVLALILDLVKKKSVPFFKRCSPEERKAIGRKGGKVTANSPIARRWNSEQAKKAIRKRWRKKKRVVKRKRK
jgi:hypothetical protein